METTGNYYLGFIGFRGFRVLGFSDEGLGTWV